MERNTGVVAALAVVLTILGVSNLPRKNTEDTTASQPRKQSATSSEARDSTKPYSPCEEIKKRLERFVPDSRLPDLKLPDSCFAPRPNPTTSVQNSAPSDLRFVIATAPNPVSTHLPLLFDRMVEVIQQAVQDENYSFDSAWLPWDDSAKDYALLGDQEAAQKEQKIQQQQPGVLVFRRAISDDTSPPYSGGLVVFLVGEQPTAGIDDRQFENALAWIKALHPMLTPDQPLEILGPTFSGSLPSLARELVSDKARPFTEKSKVRVYSGTVSSEGSFYSFKQAMGDKLADFRTYLESDSLVMRRFCQYLSGEGYKLNRVAMLSEDQTAFGGRGPGGECYDYQHNRGPIYLYYPRDIASLRSAYEQQSIFSSGKQQANQNTPGTTLRSDLSEQDVNEHDTVRTYGGQLTPLSQEAI